MWFFFFLLSLQHLLTTPSQHLFHFQRNKKGSLGQFGVENESVAFSKAQERGSQHTNPQRKNRGTDPNKERMMTKKINRSKKERKKPQQNKKKKKKKGKKKKREFQWTFMLTNKTKKKFFL